MSKQPQNANTSDMAKKKPYEKPSFRHEKVFETTALSCGKVGVTQRQCSSFRKSS